MFIILKIIDAQIKNKVKNNLCEYFHPNFNLNSKYLRMTSLQK